MSILSILIVLVCFQLIQCLYVTEAGKNDWAFHTIGGVIDAKFSNNGEKIFVVTSNGAIASLQASDGQQLWRQYIANENEKLQFIEYGVRGFVGVISDTFFRIYNSQNGALLWQLAREKDASTSSSSPAALTFSKTNDIVFVWNYDKLIAFQINQSNEKNLWSTDLPLNSGVAQYKGQFQLIMIKNDLYAVAGAGKSGLFAPKFDSETGKQDKTIKSLIDTPFHVGKQFFVSRLNGEKVLKVIDASNTALFKIDIVNRNQELLRKVSAEQKSQLLSIDVEGIDAIALFENNCKSTLSVSVFETDGAAYTWDVTVKTLDSCQIPLKKVFAWNKKGDFSKTSMKLLTVNEDDTLTLVQPSRQRAVWTREESASRVDQSLLTALPTLSLHSRRASSFIERVSWQIQKLFVNVSNEKSKFVRDSFGIDQLLLLRTEQGRIVALHTSDGSLLWAKSYFNSVDNERFYPQSMVLLQHARVTSEIGKGGATIGLIGRMNNKNTGDFALAVIDSLTGNLLNPIKTLNSINGEIVSVMQSPKLSTLLIISKNNDNKFFVQPLFTDSSDSELKLNNNIFQIQLSNNHFIGLKPTQEILTKNSSPLSISWQFNAPPGHNVVSVANTDRTERVNSIVTVLNNRTALYKQLTNNCIAVATVANNVDDQSKFNELYVHLIESGTGRVLHRSVVRDATAPVLLSMSENSVAVTYSNTRGRRFDVLINQFYAPSIDWSKQDIVDSERILTPKVYSRTLALPEQPTAIQSTQTAHGVAHRRWLFAFESGRIYEPPRPLIDVLLEQPTDSKLPASPQLPLHTLNVPSHTRELGRGASTIAVHASRLESTVVAASAGHGCDVFGWRAWPSGRFDILSDDFGRLSLVLTILGLAGATIAMRQANVNKKLQSEWA